MIFVAIFLVSSQGQVQHSLCAPGLSIMQFLTLLPFLTPFSLSPSLFLSLSQQQQYYIKPCIDLKPLIQRFLLFMSLYIGHYQLWPWAIQSLVHLSWETINTERMWGGQRAKWSILFLSTFSAVCFLNI